MMSMSIPQVNALDESTRAVLMAPLTLATGRWTSEDVAEQVGCSQSSVARVWRQTFSPIDDGPAATLRAHSGSLIAVTVTSTNAAIVIAHERAHQPSIAGNFMRLPRRVPLQAILAADLMRRDLPPERQDPLPRVWEKLLARGFDPNRLIVIARAPAPELPDERVLLVSDELRWQALLADLVGACIRTPLATLHQLQALLNDWARNRRSHFVWQTPELHARAAGETARMSTPPPPLGQAIAEAAFHVIVGRIANGQLSGGDRITESTLQRALHTSRNQVREALRNLALVGLVRLEPNRGATVPIPKAQDVIDTYDVRMALGTVLIDRAARSTHRDLRPSNAALDAMLKLAETSDARATGDADLRFQDALMSSTSMLHAASMFRALSSQILMFTSVLGLRYVYSIPDMCRDNIGMMQAVAARNPEEARTIWEHKMTAAKGFMTSHL